MTRRFVRFAAPRTVDVGSEPVPDPDPDEVLVETRVSAVSPGTELLVYRGEVPQSLEADETIDALDGTLAYPLRYGYAAVGDVVALGDGVDPAWEGRTVFGFNPHESHFTAAPDSLVEVPAGVDPETATMLPTAETAVTFAMDGAPGVGERAVVLGAGVVGLVTTALLAAFPLEELAVVEPCEERRKTAARLGADRTLTPEEVGSVFADSDPPGADLVYELTGSPAALDDAIAAVGYDGRVVVGSWYGRKRADVDLGGFFHRNRVDLCSSQVSTIAPDHRGRWTKERRLDAAWDHLLRTPVDGLITHRLPVGEAPEAYSLLDDGDAVQLLFAFDDPEA